MVVPFYMLIRTRIRESKNVVHATLKIEGVKVSHSVMGNYDVILYAEGKDLEDVRRIRNLVFDIPGVTITETVVHA
jgi:DNA-binding Lrp family transcriptional regulator